MILSALLKPVEKCLNQYLAADIEKSNAVHQLNGKIIHLYLIPLNFECYVLIENGKLSLTKQYHNPANVIIRGTPLALLNLLKSQNSVLPESVTLTGDIPIVQKLQNIFTSIEIDWEEKLSHYVGDVAAHTLCQQWRKLCDYQHYAVKSFTRSSKEFLQEELCFFPTRNELTEFYNEVDQLRDALDRLSARIDLLTQSET
jgi:ubiquinone biosynthesis accessory factor UbiJ